MPRDFVSPDLEPCDLEPRDFVPSDFEPRDFVPRAFVPHDLEPRDFLPPDLQPRGLVQRHLTRAADPIVADAADPGSPGSFATRKRTQWPAGQIHHRYRQQSPN